MLRNTQTSALLRFSASVPTSASVRLAAVSIIAMTALFGTAEAATAAPDTSPVIKASAQPPANPQPATPAERIVAVVNGDVISQADVENRGKLFALSTGLPVNPDVLARLRPQVTQQLIDERLRLQEEQRRKIVISDKQIAAAIDDIEKRNGMEPGTLRRKLGDQGVALRTLIDQVRVQIGWGRVLREELGDKLDVSDADVAEQLAQIKAQTGQPEYRVAEIFLPIEDPSKAAETQKFADTIIQQLRAGAPFGVVAAQFSQSQTALQGGDLGWLRVNQMDPQVATLVAEMPDGAVSNPIRVPGGITIVSRRGKREIGSDVATVLSLRQVFLPFSSPLNVSAPTDQQKHQLEQAKLISASAHSCDAMEAANKAAGTVRPSDPGEVRFEGLAPPMKALLGSLQPGQATRPLVSSDGIGILMVCSRDQKNLAAPNKQDISNQLLNDRVELVSRQLVRDLRRRAVIDQRG
jgi:peptidyl-prolyl cis-trans isomerase SurA